MEISRRNYESPLFYIHPRFPLGEDFKPLSMKIKSMKTLKV